MRTAGDELRLAARRLIHDRSFTVIAALALGLGIGVNSTFFSLVNAAVLRGLPIDAPHAVTFVTLRDARNVPRGLTLAEYEELRSRTRTFSAVGAFTTAPMVFADAATPTAGRPLTGAPPQRVLGTTVSASGMRILGVPPLRGRQLGPSDDRAGAAPVVVVSERLWRTRYGAEPSVVGRQVVLNGQHSTIVGVMPEEFRFPTNSDVWRPLAALPSPPRDARVLSAFGRLSPDAAIAQAQSELDTMRAGWARREPATYEGLRASVVPINEQLFGRVTDTVWLAFITAGALVLVIACANVANLLLMRAASRGPEMAVRMSLGATRTRIVRQLLVESALLAALGGFAGLGLSFVGLGLLQAQVPADVAVLFDFTLDARVVGVLVAACVASVFVFGLTPAVVLARRSTADALKESGRGSGAISRRRWAAVFLAAEFALTLVLLANVAEAIRVAAAAREAQFPIDPDPLLTMSVTLPAQPYSTADARAAFFDRLQETLAAVPSVSAVAMASVLPGGGSAMSAVTIAGRPPLPAASTLRAGTLVIGGRYFDAIAAPLLRGRAFDASDGRSGRETAIVNERFAEVFLPGVEAIGALVRIERDDGPEPSPWRRIVGVAPSIRQSSADGIEPDPIVYLPLPAAVPSTLAIIVRASADPRALTPSIRDAVRRLDSSLPLDRVLTMTDATRQAQWNGRISRVLLHGIGAIALLLALVGLYAVTAHSVRLRQRELGIRMALGAPRWRVAALVLRRALLQLTAGVAAGLGTTLAFDRLFVSGGGSLMDAVVILPTIVVMALAGAAACLWPASCAARADPAVVLREE